MTIGAPVDVLVVIPVHRRPDRVREAVASVLAQELPPSATLRITVVDDGSDDATPDAVRDIADAHPEVRAVLLDRNRGPSAARNAALREPDGDARWVTFLDSDDLMLPGRLSFQLARLDAEPPCDAVTGLEVIEVQPGVTPPPWVQRLAPPDAIPRHYVMSMMLALDTLRAVGGFDESIRVGEDADLAVRLRHHGVRFAHEERPVTVRRIFGDNLIYDDDLVRTAMVRALRSKVERARRSGPATS